MLISIDRNGQIEMIANDAMAGLLSEGNSSQRRASHVTPADPILKAVFRLIRWATGERGKWSDWTRRWKCRWEVQIVAGPYLGEFDLRSDAINAEIEWLENNYFTRNAAE